MDGDVWVLKETYIANAENVDGVLFQVTRSDRALVKGAYYVPELSPTFDLLNAYQYKSLSWEDFTEEFREQILNDDKAMNILKEIFEISKVADAYLICYEKKYPCHRFLLIGIANEKWGDEKEKPPIIPTEIIIDSREQNIKSGKTIMMACLDKIVWRYEHLGKKVGDIRVELGDYAIRNRLYGDVRIEYMTLRDAYDKWLGKRRGTLDKQIHDLLEEFGNNAKLVVNLDNSPILGIDNEYFSDEIASLIWKHLQTVNDEQISVIFVRNLDEFVGKIMRLHLKMTKGEYGQRVISFTKTGARTKQTKIDILCACPYIDVKRAQLILSHFDDDVLKALGNIDEWIDIRLIGKKIVEKVKNELKNQTVVEEGAGKNTDILNFGGK